MKRSLISPFKRITTQKPNATVLLFLAAVLAVIVANSSMSGFYNTLLDYKVSLQIGGYELFAHHGETMTLLQFVNDALMAIFFFVVGLEIKQEMLVGELSSVRKALLPVIAAFGGMIVPILFYMLICHSGDAARGAAIPMATDIAFALAVLSMLGKKVPTSLKTFLTALAVVDDIGGIVVIAIFYSSHIEFGLLLAAFAIIVFMFLCGKFGYARKWLYYIGGIIVWTLFLESGVHATIAGVLVAFTIPTKTKICHKKLQDEIQLLFNMMPSGERSFKGSTMLSHKQVEVLHTIQQTAYNSVPLVQEIESNFSSFVNYVVLPLFAFVNAGVVIGGVTTETLMGVPLAIVLGLVLGKCLGIFSFTWLFVKSGVGKMPKGMTTHNLLALSMIGGVGFTVSLFLASLSFGEAMPELFNGAKIGIFAGSIISGVVGFFWLRHVLNKEHALAASKS
ncbi:Na+/H+ antiporter NhaA [Falsiporphyromonas endometrii]|uniref:Na(+)/H(+) antiporter NhaA n=1 Tax=Falsiporphyromonas endometrii TaxID=1387297 RepID=A0ABV9K6K6_9PORP